MIRKSRSRHWSPGCSTFYPHSISRRAGKSPADALHFVASGPFGDQALHGNGWAVAGLGIHLAIMAVMASTYVLLAPTYGMSSGKIAYSIGNALFSHCILVGLPIAFIARMGGDGSWRGR